jgi:UDP-N-acetylmuramoyl-tripeptide--D-alanyl-D-alanine ligase
MNQWTPQQVAAAAGARLIAPPRTSTGPERVTIDSRDAGPGALFVGLKGEHTDGGRFAAAALAAGAWGVIASSEHAQATQIGELGAVHIREAGSRAGRTPEAGNRADRANEAGSRAGRATEARNRAGRTPEAPPGVLLSAEDPLKALQNLATAWRRALKAAVIGVTGSTGKTSTKELLLAVLAPHRRTVASRANFNTEIGLPLEILAAPAGTEVLVLEMGMRGVGQIAELAAIAEPDVAVIVSIGPVHLELLGTVEAVAVAKAELIAALQPGGTAVVPAGERLIEPHLRDDVRTVTFGPGGDVELIRSTPTEVEIAVNPGRFGSAESPAGIGRFPIDEGQRISLQVPFPQAHLRQNLLAAVAAAIAVGVTPDGRVEMAISAGRGRRMTLPSGITIIDDCYNANPMSMRTALDDLAATAAQSEGARRVAVLGDMLELGPDEREYHVQIGARAAEVDVDLLVTVGPLAAAMSQVFDGEIQSVADAAEAAALLPELVAAGDVVLVKASRGVGLELVCQALAESADGVGETADADGVSETAETLTNGANT